MAFLGIAAFMLGEGQYLVALVAALFMVLGLYLGAFAGRYETSPQSITHRNLFGTFRIAWKDVTKVEMGSSMILLRGTDKHFAMIPSILWSGPQ